MQKFRAFFVLVGLSFSVSAQTDAQLDQIRADVKNLGVASFLQSFAPQAAEVIRRQNSAEGLESLGVTVSGSVMTVTWKVLNAQYNDIDKSMELQTKDYTIKTVCNQKLRGMLVKEFGATMLTRYVDRNNRFIFEFRVDKESCR